MNTYKIKTHYNGKTFTRLVQGVDENDAINTFVCRFFHCYYNENLINDIQQDFKSYIEQLIGCRFIRIKPIKNYIPDFSTPKFYSC